MSTTIKPKYTNLLIHETSPYLLQHAHNPVNWYAWNENTLEIAKKENKLMLISIGYSACHWCHVMEHESFEDEEVAEIMNQHFICIKVDREERPDIDQVYMNAVQLMTGQGGWPLNCIALPDQRPVYGGTYFPKNQWTNILLTLADLYKNEPQKMQDYAEKLTTGIKQSELVEKIVSEEDFDQSIITQTIHEWTKRFDNQEGGPEKAPKFPLPNNYLFLLKYSHLNKALSPEQNTKLKEHIELTLDKMAYGGIYDQIGGGFARYSTDLLWKVPHFEKMLYDNAQLVSLYSEAFLSTGKALYKEVVYETLSFIERELTSDEGNFYSALDADSEEQEGKYYIWTKKELEEVLGENYSFIADYYNLNDYGYWENDEYILLRRKSDEEITKKYNLSVDEIKKKVTTAKVKLLAVREKRIKPGLDDKILTSWNALMLKGYIDAYMVFEEIKFQEKAIKNAEFIVKKLRGKDGGLFHSYKNGKASINGYLEDYAFTIEAFIALYQATFNEQWLLKAREWMNYVIAHFQDKGSKMFYFTSDLDPALIARKMEVMDNVIPASNSGIAKSLFLLGHYFNEKEYIDISRQMLKNIINLMPAYGSGYSNWGILALQFIFPFHEMAIVGNSVEEKRKELSKHYIPNLIFAGSSKESDLPLLKNRHSEKTLIYVCVNNSCKLPVEQVSEALEQLNTN